MQLKLRQDLKKEFNENFLEYFNNNGHDKTIAKINSLTDIEKPHYTLMSANVLLNKINKEYFNNMGMEGTIDNLFKHVTQLSLHGTLDERIIKNYNSSDINQFIDLVKKEVMESYNGHNNIMLSDSDLYYDYAGMSLMNKTYLLKDSEGDIIETPILMYSVLSLMLASVERKNKVKYAFEYFKKIFTRKLSLATPILLNLRVKGGNLSSCFIGAVDDSLHSLNHVQNSVALISQQAGGVGVDYGRIRAFRSMIGNSPKASGGVMPFIKIIDTISTAVNQKGKRKGAITVAMPVWHLDIETFLHSQTENGDLRNKAFNIFPQITLPDLFMEKVITNDDFYLFCPTTIKKYIGVTYEDLTANFTQSYNKILELINKTEIIDSFNYYKKVNARDLFKEIMKVQIETGLPYLFFTDTANRLNPNKDTGNISCGNLCMESFSNFKPTNLSTNKPDIVYGNISRNDYATGYFHTCNLASPNLALIEGENLIEMRKDIESVFSLCVRILDNTIELTNPPINEALLHNNDYRIIGVGSLGLADLLAKNKIKYSESSEFVDQLFEVCAYYTLKESIKLSKERGKYPLFNKSDWSKGILFGKDTNWFAENKTFLDRDLWNNLIKEIKKHGLRNGGFLAIPPNTSTSLLVGATASILPVYSKEFVDSSSKFSSVIYPPYIKERFWYYQENKNIPQSKVVNVISSAQKWVDQGISFELMLNINDGIIKDAKDFYDILIYAWTKDIKTIYYIRQNKKISQESSCVSCAN